MYTYGNVTRNELNGDVVDRLPPESKDYEKYTMTEAQREKLLADIKTREKENDLWHKEWLRWKACLLSFPKDKQPLIRALESSGKIPNIFGTNSMELSLIADYYVWAKTNDVIPYADYIEKVVKNG